MRRLAALAALLASPAAADLTAAEAEVLPRIVSAVQIDLLPDRDGAEQAVLLTSTDPDAFAADLVILTGPMDSAPGTPVVLARGAAYLGGLYGQSPWLEVAQNGSLLLRSEQIAIGRDAWEMTLTLAAREGRVLVAGLTHTSWDRATAGSSRCDWNLLTGNWVLDWARDAAPDQGITADNGQRQGREPHRIGIEHWAASGAALPDFCQHDFP